MTSNQIDKYQFDVVVIGGGFFGVRIAFECAKLNKTVALLEREPSLMSRASLNNQARIHNGYHYPRSYLTAIRSRVNFPRFVKEYPECIDSSFLKVYAIARRLSKVNANQFFRFINRIGASIKPASSNVRKLFAQDFIEASFECLEFAFDAKKLMQKAEEQARNAGASLFLNSEVIRIIESRDYITTEVRSAEGACELRSKIVFNSTYSRLNGIMKTSSLRPIPLKHELTEMCLVDPPDELRKLGVTVMCGPFFSIMPYPSLGLHTLSHVRYTPHLAWAESKPDDPDPYLVLNSWPRKTSFQAMKTDASRYMPLVKACQYKDSLFEVKTVLPRSEGDDSRPILFKRATDCSRLVNVLGGKIDNVFDASGEINTICRSI